MTHEKIVFFESVTFDETIIFDGFTDTLKKGGRIEIRGFGVFTVREYDGYTGRNPKTGDTTEVEAKKLPFFKVGKELRERVNAG